MKDEKLWNDGPEKIIISNLKIGGLLWELMNMVGIWLW